MKFHLLIVLAIVSVMQVDPARCASRRQSIEEILALPDDSLDVGIACFAIASDVYPKLDFRMMNGVIDQMAQRIALLSQGQTDPVTRIGLLNTYFFRPGWWNDSVVFTFDTDDLWARRRQNRYLNGYLSTRKGSCVTMAMLYLAVADRLHWPIVPVRAAKHIFCRYLASGFSENNIEPTCGGGYLTDRQYIEQGGIPKRAVKNGVYLRALTKREYIATLLSNHALQLLEDGREDIAKHYLETAVAIDQTLSTAYWNLGEFHYQKARALDSILAGEEAADEGLDRQAPPRAQSLTAPVPLRAGRGLVGGLGPDRIDLEAAANSALEAKQAVGTTAERLALSANVPHQVLQSAEVLAARCEWRQRIQYHLEQWKALKKKAKELGIAPRLPPDFFLRQARAIEEFKKTGRY